MTEQTAHDTLLDWLREAHAFALHGETMLNARADALEAYPQLRTRIEGHAEQTHDQARRLALCIEQLGGETSQVKDIGGRLSALGHSLGTRLSGEPAVQSHAATYAFEHFEIANYRALIIAAEAAGEGEIKATCEEFLAEQKVMADWLDDHLAETTRLFIDGD